MRDSDRCVGEGMWGMVIRDVARDRELRVKEIVKEILNEDKGPRPAIFY